MDIKNIVNSIFLKASNNKIIEGKKIFEKDFVKSVKSKKIDDFYHIYGIVNGEGRIPYFNTHLVIDLNNKLVKKNTCNCDEFKEGSKYKKDFLCKHIIATNFKFCYLITKKYINKEKNKPIGENILDFLEEKIKERTDILNLHIKLTYIENKNLSYYDVEFRIGNETMHLINNLEEFIEFREKEQALRFNSNFIYKPKIQSFNKKDEKIIDFIDQYVKYNKLLVSNNNFIGNFQFIRGKNLRVLPNVLRKFLELLADKTIHIKYEALDTNLKVLKKELPINFTLKEKKNELILTTYNEKKLPKALTNKEDVYLFNREIYLPSKKQCILYKSLEEKIIKYGELRFHKSIDNFNRLMKILNNVTKHINFDEGVKNFYNNISKPEFCFHKKNNHILCSVKIDYGNDTIDILKEYDKENLIVRDNLKEEKIIMLLEKFRFIKRKEFFVFIGDDEELYELLISGIKELNTIGNVKLTESFKKLKVYNTLNINYDINEKNSKFIFQYFFYDIEDLDVKNMYEAFKADRKFFRDKDSFINIKDENIKEFFTFIEGINAIDILGEKQINIDKNKIFYLEEKIKKNKSLNLKEKIIINEIIEKFKNIENLNYNVPIDLKANLRDYQLYGYKWMKILAHLGFGGILADEMGLGKTIQTIAFLLSEKGKKSLIVTPTSLIYNWISEIEKFAPNLKIAIIHGEKKKRLKLIKDLEKYDIVLTSYGTLRLDIEYYKNLNFEYCIIDEAQNIKNPNTKNTMMLKEINSNIKFALTGTPIENNLLELWSIFDFVMPEYLYTQEVFENKFIKEQSLNMEELKKLIKPFILRRIKQDVLNELPDKIEKKFLVEMTNSQKKLYKSYIKDIRIKLEKEKENKITIFSYLTKLRQLCLDPSLLINNYVGGSGKIKIVLDIIKEPIKENKKILIFSQFTSLLKNLGDILHREKINYFYLDGTIKADERIKLVDDFNKNTEVNIFLISLKAGGTGLNLTSASLVIHFDPWWNPSVEDQATDRAHRIGQKESVQVIKLISAETIEEKIICLQEKKKKLINDIITDNIGTITDMKNLTEEEIMLLFE